MSLAEAIAQFILAGGSVVAATLIGRRFPYLGALVLLFPIKVLTTLVFLPGDKELLSRFLIALIPGLLAVAAFSLAAKLALARMTSFQAFGVGLVAWAVVAGFLAVAARPWI